MFATLTVLQSLPLFLPLVLLVVGVWWTMRE